MQDAGCNIESVLLSGVIDDLGSNHRPIFAMFRLNLLGRSANSEPKLTQYYSFPKTNAESLIHDLESKTEVLKGSNRPNFEEFLILSVKLLTYIVNLLIQNLPSEIQSIIHG